MAITEQDKDFVIFLSHVFYTYFVSIQNKFVQIKSRQAMSRENERGRQRNSELDVHLVRMATMKYQS